MTLSYRTLTFCETFKLQVPKADPTNKEAPNESLPIFLISIIFYLPTFLMSNIICFKPLVRSLCYPFLDWVPCPFSPLVHFSRYPDRPFHFYNFQKPPSPGPLCDRFCFLWESTQGTVRDRLHQRQDQEIYNAVAKLAPLGSGCREPERPINAV